jgi:hypothetical protein
MFAKIFGTMKLVEKILLIGAIWMLPAGLFAAGVKVETYALIFRDSSVGSWIHIHYGGREYEVKLAKDSSRAAVESIGALDQMIVNVNSSPESNIYLCGTFVPDESVDPKAPTGVLKLEGWYLKTPFYLPNPSEPDGPLKVSEKLSRDVFSPEHMKGKPDVLAEYRRSLEIQFEPRMKVFWIGVRPPMAASLGE